MRKGRCNKVTRFTYSRDSIYIKVLKREITEMETIFVIGREGENGEWKRHTRAT